MYLTFPPVDNHAIYVLYISLLCMISLVFLYKNSTSNYLFKPSFLFIPHNQISFLPSQRRYFNFNNAPNFLSSFSYIHCLLYNITALWLSHTLPTYIELPSLLTMPLYSEIRFFSQTNHSTSFSIREREVIRMKTFSMKYCDFFLNYSLLLDPSRKDFSFSVRGTISCHKSISFPSPFLLRFLKTNDKTALQHISRNLAATPE